MRSSSSCTLSAPKTSPNVSAAMARSRTASCIRSTRWSILENATAASLGGRTPLSLVRLALTDTGQLRPADRAASLRSGPPILQRHLLGVLDLPLGPALHAVSFHKAPLLTLRIPIP